MEVKDFLHYSEVPPCTSGERTVYGKKEKGLDYVYSDRLIEWNRERAEKAVTENTQDKHTVEYYEEYLSIYYEKQIKLVHMLIGVNISNGWCYHVYGYKER